MTDISLIKQSILHVWAWQFPELTCVPCIMGSFLLPLTQQYCPLMRQCDCWVALRPFSFCLLTHREVSLYSLIFTMIALIVSWRKHGISNKNNKDSSKLAYTDNNSVVFYEALCCQEHVYMIQSKAKGQRASEKEKISDEWYRDM